MKKNSVVHFEMPAKDKNRVAKFYRDVFGWEMMILGPDMQEYILATTTETDKKGRPRQPGAINGGFYKWSEEFKSPSIVVSVENLEKSMEEVKKAGGKILGKPMDIPTVGLYISFLDSEGNRVGMLQTSK